jgi:hypothetical protein
VADDLDVIEPDRSIELTRRALRLSELAVDLTACAALERDGSLD